jgi:hypothetical protein
MRLEPTFMPRQPPLEFASLHQYKIVLPAFQTTEMLRATCLAEASHMDIAGGQEAVSSTDVRSLPDRKESSGIALSKRRLTKCAPSIAL